MKTRQQISIGISDLCFGCGKNNPCGLKLNFEWDGKKARAKFTPTELHQGWEGIVHGGIIATILDEAMGYATDYEGIRCVTGIMQTRFKRSASVGEPLVVTASMTKNARRFTETEAKITLTDGTIIAESTAMQYVGSSKSQNTSIKDKPKNNAQKQG